MKNKIKWSKRLALAGIFVCSMAAVMDIMLGQYFWAALMAFCTVLNIHSYKKIKHIEENLNE